MSLSGRQTDAHRQRKTERYRVKDTKRDKSVTQREDRGREWTSFRRVYGVYTTACKGEFWESVGDEEQKGSQRPNTSGV